MTAKPPPPPPEQQPVVVAPQKTNTLAIVSLISAFFISILGIILGHIALSQIKKTGEGGRGLALAGTILGYVFLVFQIVAIILIIATGAFFASQNQSIEELIDEMEENQGETSQPWVGTEAEDFCDVYYGSDGAARDADEYFELLVETAPDSDLSQKFDRLAEIHGSNEVSDELLEENNDLLVEVEDEAWEVCSAAG